MHKSTVNNRVLEVSFVLYQRQQDYISFPSEYEARYQKAAEYYHKYGRKPLCMGAVDGTHVPILRPSVNEQAFVNGKGYHSLNVMVGITGQPFQLLG